MCIQMIQQICFSIYHSSHVKMEAEIQFTRNLGSRVWSKNKSSKKKLLQNFKETQIRQESNLGS